jgi:lysozyme
MKHEGFVNKPYDDKGGIAIGYGSNLSRRGLSRDEAYYLMHNDVVRIEEALPGISPASETISHGRYAVLVSMAYNLGLDGLSQFHRFLAALEAQNYELAAKEMERSLWCVQVGKRCEELASIMRRGYI